VREIPSVVMAVIMLLGSGFDALLVSGDEALLPTWWAADAVDRTRYRCVGSH
jgi:hypothetical protein